MKKYLSLVTVLLFLTVITGFGAVWYVQILKWLVCVGACWLGYNYLKVNKKILITFVIIAILYNPIVPIYFQDIARIVCLIVGVIFFPFAFDKYLPFAMKVFKETQTENQVTEEVEENKEAKEAQKEEIEETQTPSDEKNEQ